MLEWIANLDGDTRVAMFAPFAIFIFYIWLRSAQHMMAMVNNSKQKYLMYVLAPVAIFFPALFTDQGNYHRKEFLKYADAFVAMCSTPFIVQWFLDYVA